MHVHKLGHCCLVVEINEKRIMTDPGAWSTLQNEAQHIDLILITHEHQDHLHIESLKAVIKNNPSAQIITNTTVSDILKKENISCTVVDHNESFNFSGTMIRGYGEKHAPIIDIIPQVQNTGYTIGETFYYPGDAFFVPPIKIDVLAVPVCGPWMHISDAVEFVKQIQPKACFPVHDGMLKIIGPFHRVPAMAFEKLGIQFVPMLEGDSHKF